MCTLKTKHILIQNPYTLLNKLTILQGTKISTNNSRPFNILNVKHNTSTYWFTIELLFEYKILYLKFAFESQ